MEKVIDIEERIPSMREKRRKKTNRKFVLILLVFALVLLVLLYFQSPLSRIGVVHVSPVTLYDEQFYIEISGLAPDDAFWGFSMDTIETKLQTIDAVKTVSVKRKWLHDIDIQLVEWQTVAYIEEEGHYLTLLENGEVFPNDRNVSLEAPILIDFHDLEVRKRMTNQLLKLTNDVYPLISEILFTGTGEDTDSLTVYMDDGYEVHAILPTFAEKMQFYSEITAQLDEKGIIDMEVGTYFVPFTEVYGKAKEEESDAEKDE